MFDARGSVQSPDPIAQLSPRHKQRLLWLFLAWAAVLVVLGTVGIVRVASNVGKTFGGFIWIFDPSRDHPFFAGPELWRSRPPSPTEIHLLDEIVHIDGLLLKSADRSTWRSLKEVYDRKQVGETVAYEVQRAGQILTIVEPVHLFAWDTFILSHGLLYLTGLAFVGAGYTLLRFTNRRDLALFAFALLPAAGAWFFHGETASIHETYVSPNPIGWVLWTPALPMVGAILLHFAAIFPKPRGLARRHPQLIYLGYGFAAVLMLSYATTLRHETFQISIATIVSMGLFATLGISAVLVSGVLSYREARLRNDIVQRRMVETLAVVGLIGAAIFSGFGIVPFLLLGYPLLPWEVLITLATLYPLALVYALRNAEMIAQLHQEITIKQQFSDKVNELQHIREQTLHEVADALHDRVIPDLRGLHFAAVAAQRRLSPPVDLALAGDLSFIADTLTALGDQARAIMEGAKPIDWRETGLQEALAWLVNSFQRANPHLIATLNAGGYDEDDAAATKEALYLIARAALTNVQEHAQAQRVDVTLTNTPDSVSLRLSDDGAGFDPATTPPRADRRHLGLGNMRLRAQEIGAEFVLASQPGFGTSVEVVAPRSAQN